MLNFPLVLGIIISSIITVIMVLHSVVRSERKDQSHREGVWLMEWVSCGSAGVCPALKPIQCFSKW